MQDENLIYSGTVSLDHPIRNIPLVHLERMIACECDLATRSSRMDARNLLRVLTFVVLREVYVQNHFIIFQFIFQVAYLRVLMRNDEYVATESMFQIRFELLVKISDSCVQCFFLSNIHRYLFGRTRYWFCALLLSGCPLLVVNRSQLYRSREFVHFRKPFILAHVTFSVHTGDIFRAAERRCLMTELQQRVGGHLQLIQRFWLIYFKR